MTQPLGPTMDCIGPDCANDTWPEEDWVIFDTPVGAFEVLLCEAHCARYEAGQFSPLGDGGWLRACELVNSHPVKHGSTSPAPASV